MPQCGTCWGHWHAAGLDLHEEIKVHSRRLKTQTKDAAPQLVEAVGVGLDIAEMLVGPSLGRSAQPRAEPMRAVSA